MRGLIHIYCGDGKGKTTASLGLAIRAAGSGMKVVFAQFLKGSDTSELESLQQIKGITVLRNSIDFGFYNRMTEEDKLAIKELHNETLTKAMDAVLHGECDLLILDEVIATYNYGLIDTELVDELVAHKKPELELVLTGRDPAEHFIKAADYVSEIHKVKHPYDQKVVARKGIEF